jgi:inhibitor of KinA sporulation pathway (predicted exonuclease)
MLDLETLGTSPNSMILSIGAVKFADGEILDSFYERVDPSSQTKYGMEIDPKTFQWWIQQSDESRKELTLPSQPIEAVLSWFAEWAFDPEVKVWGNGVAMDNVILTNAYNKVGIPRPWSYRGDMCYRTIKNLYPDIKIKQEGVYHNALDDARSQAIHLMKMIKI